MTYKTVHRRVERFIRALDASRLDPVGPAEADEVYVSVGLKGRKRDFRSRSRGLPTRGRGSYEGGEPPTFTIADRGMGQRYAALAKSADGSTVRLLLADHKEESLIIHVDGFRAYGLPEDGNELAREYVAHGDDEYVDEDIHVSSYESHAPLARWRLPPHRDVSKGKLTQYLHVFQLRSELFRRPGQEILKHAVEATL